jgi:hypothetical protein
MSDFNEMLRITKPTESVCEISSLHGGEDDSVVLVACDAV